MRALPTVEQSATGEWWVVRAMGPFRTNEAAWKWVDQHTNQGRADDDRYNKIRIAFSKCGASSNSRRNAGKPPPDEFRHDTESDER